MQAIWETLVLPADLEELEFMVKTCGEARTYGQDVTATQNVDKFLVRALMYADDMALMCASRSDLVRLAKCIDKQFGKFGLKMHTGVTGDKKLQSKTEAMFIPAKTGEWKKRKPSPIYLTGGRKIPFTKEFKYLGGIIHCSLSCEVDVDRRISSASQAMGSLKGMIRRKDINSKVKGRVYVSLVLSILLYGCENWTLQESLMKKLRNFHNLSMRQMCRINMKHTRMHEISSKENDLAFRISYITFTFGFFAGLGMCLACHLLDYLESS